MAEHAAGPLFSIGPLEVNSITVTTWGIMLVLALAAFLLTRKLSISPQGRAQTALELGIGSLVGFLGTIMGSEEKARKYFPILGSFFLVILAGNYAGLLPGAGHLPGFQAPTSALSYTAALAVTVFCITHASGFKAHGIRYLKHFIEPYPVMLPLNLMEELIKPLSLALRLYGNVYGEETLVASIFAIVPLFLPLPFMFLGVFFGFIQALVFTLLTATYLAAATGGHEESTTEKELAS